MLDNYDKYLCPVLIVQHDGAEKEAFRPLSDDGYNVALDNYDPGRPGPVRELPVIICSYVDPTEG